MGTQLNTGSGAVRVMKGGRRRLVLVVLLLVPFAGGAETLKEEMSRLIAEDARTAQAKTEPAKANPPKAPLPDQPASPAAPAAPAAGQDAVVNLPRVVVQGQRPMDRAKAVETIAGLQKRVQKIDRAIAAAERDEVPTGLDETLNDPAWSFAGRETAPARAAAAGRTTEGLELERMLALNVIGVLAKFRDGRKISREEQAALERDLQTLESRNRPR
jgi:pyruvate/2-oxoglutarate dehydrogenase complex dihydrolipoamide acyltransferase (E2) component